MLQTHEDKFKIVVFLLFIFILCGCSRLEQLDRKVGEMFFNEKNQTSTSSPFEKKAVPPIKAKDLSKEQKEQIDQWLESNSYNRYGDAQDAQYAGGTPLFDEATGKSLDRYDYILERHPDILERLK